MNIRLREAVALNRKIYRCRFYLPGNICFSVSQKGVVEKKNLLISSGEY